MTRDMTDAVVAVIGASGELGRRVAERLAASGARLVLVGRDDDRLASTGLDGPRVVGDITDAGLGDALVKSATEAFGRLDGVVNAAGVVAFGPLVDATDSVIEEVFLVDVLGPLWLTRKVIPALRESKGLIVSMSGVIAATPMPGMVAYSAAKAALGAANVALAKELRRDRIQVIDIQPPHTETGLATRPIAGTAPKFPPGAHPDAVADRIVSAIRNGETLVKSDEFG
ncbi:MAG: SDR family oxidoreductase [Brevibacterium aurantiacum]|nr:SDR family oxidoreductase [Brevibacterium aurantiacum]